MNFSPSAFPADDLRRGFASRAERQLHVRQLHQLYGAGVCVCDGWRGLCRRMRVRLQPLKANRFLQTRERAALPKRERRFCRMRG